MKCKLTITTEVQIGHKPTAEARLQALARAAVAYANAPSCTPIEAEAAIELNRAAVNLAAVVRGVETDSSPRKRA